MIYVNRFSIDTASRKKKDGFIRACFHDFVYLLVLSAGGFRGPVCQLDLWYQGQWGLGAGAS